MKGKTRLKQSALLGALAIILLLTLACLVTADPTPPPVTTEELPPGVATPAPEPTPTPTPRATTPPTPAPTAPPVDDQLDEVAFGFIRDLSEGLGPRQSATDQELAAAHYLEGLLSSMGYTTEFQPFLLRQLSTSLTVAAPENEPSGTVPALPLEGTAAGQVTGPLVRVGLARPVDIPPEGLAGKVALVERGLTSFQQKVRLAQDAGALGVVIYNNRRGNFSGDLGGVSKIPAVSIAGLDGLALEELLDRGSPEVTLSIDAEETPSRNVLAEKPGRRDEVVVLGAHYDTVPAVPGAHDNASGTAVLLTLAREMADHSFPFTLRFIAFGSEELGLHGSQSYVDSLSPEERERIVAMLNFDSLGSGTSLRVLGDPELTGLVIDAGVEEGIDVQLSPGLGRGGSDHLSFSQVGIPVVMFGSDDFSRGHTPEDVLEFINPELPGDAARLALALLRYLGQPTGEVA